jgi:hypothetical protein
MWRAIFVLPLFYYYIAWRRLIGPRTGILVTDTDSEQFGAVPAYATLQTALRRASAGERTGSAGSQAATSRAGQA